MKNIKNTWKRIKSIIYLKAKIQSLQKLSKQSMVKHLLIQDYLLINPTVFFAQKHNQSKKKLAMPLSHFKTIYQSHVIIHLL